MRAFRLTLCLCLCLSDGGQFWVNGTQGLPDLPATAFAMRGAGGQSVTIDREHDLVIVRLGHRKGEQGGLAAGTLNDALRILRATCLGAPATL